MSDDRKQNKLQFYVYFKIVLLLVNKGANGLNNFKFAYYICGSFKTNFDF